MKVTTAFLRRRDLEVLTLEGLLKCFPTKQDIGNIPIEKTRFAANAEELIEQGNRHVLKNIVNLLLWVVERSTSIILPIAFKHIMGVTANKIKAKKWSKIFFNPAKREKSLETMALSLFAIPDALPPKTIAAQTTWGP